MLFPVYVAGSDAGAAPAGVAEVSWPKLPAGIRASITLRCDACGYAVGLHAAVEPESFAEVVGGFLATHSRHGRPG